jgi:outer membrane protein assembly factor BamB
VWTQVWSFATQNPVAAGVAIDGAGVVFVASEDYNVYALDAHSRGTLLWTFDTQFFVEVSPVVGPGGWLYIASCDGNVYALANA